MVNRQQIFINGQEVELLEDVSIPTTYSVNDIREPEKRKANFTKTVRLPGTRINNKLFSDIYDIKYIIQSTGSVNFAPDFNPNLKASCEYLLDGISQLKGYVQLLNIVLNEDGRLEYEVSISGMLGNIFSNMSSKKLSELNMSFLNHTYDKSTIENSWTNTNGYTYPMIDYGTTNNVTYKVTDFYPAIYAKTIWDKIFEENGFSYSSSFLNTSPFNKLVVPFVGDRFGLTASQIADRSCRASTSTQFLHLGNSSISTIQINDDTTSPNYDPSNYWDTANYKFDAVTPRIWTVKLGINTTFNWTRTGTTVNQPRLVGYFRLNHYQASTNTTQLLVTVGLWVGTVSGSQPSSSNPYLLVPIGNTAVTAGTTTSSSVTYSFNATSNGVGDYFFWQYQHVNTGDWLEQGYAGSNAAIYHSCWCEVTPFTTTYVEGDNIDANLILSDKVKQSEFIKSIIQMFNLFVDVDKDDSNKLLIEPRNDYYAGGSSVNWESKIDYSKEIKFTPMGELDGKRYIWSYKDDGDYFNDLYKKKWGETYGYKFKDINNDFIKNEKKNEVVFSPTPCAEISNTDRVIPRIFVVDQAGTTQRKAANIRILYYAGLVNTSNVWNLQSQGTNYIKNQYPLVSHVDYPFAPSLDLSFGVPREVYWNTLSYTPNNLYNTYYKQMIDEITDPNSKIVTAYVRLTPSDILDLDFRNSFFWGGVNFRLNKILDHNPLVSDLTKCEFFKVKLGVPYTGTSGVTGIESGFDEDLQVSTLRTPMGVINPVRQLGSGGGITVYPYEDNVLVTGNKVYISAGASNIALLNVSGVSVGADVSGITAINTVNKEFNYTNSGETWVNGYRYASENISIKNADYSVVKSDNGKLFQVSSSGFDRNLTLPYGTDLYSGWKITVKNRSAGSGYNVNIVISEPSRYFEDGSTTFLIPELDCYDIYYSDDTFYIK